MAKYDHTILEQPLRDIIQSYFVRWIQFGFKRGNAYFGTRFYNAFLFILDQPCLPGIYSTPLGPPCGVDNPATGQKDRTEVDYQFHSCSVDHFHARLQGPPRRTSFSPYDQFS